MDFSELTRTVEAFKIEDQKQRQLLQNQLREYKQACMAQTTASVMSPSVLPSLQTQDFTVIPGQHIEQSDFDTTVSRLVNEYQSEFKTPEVQNARTLMLDFFEKEADNQKNLPAIPPFMGDIMESEIMQNQQIPIPDAPSTISFMLQDNLKYYQMLQTLEQSLFIHIRRQHLRTFNVEKLQKFTAEILGLKANTKNLIERLCATASAAFVKIPNQIQQDVQKLFPGSLVKSNDSFITKEDLMRSIYHNNKGLSFIEQIYSQILHIGLTRRKELIQKSFTKAKQMVEFSYTSQELISKILKRESIDFLLEPGLQFKPEQFIASIQICSSFKTELDFTQLFETKIPQNLQELAQRIDGESDPYGVNQVVKLSVENLRDQNKIYGRDVQKEATCSKLRQQAMFQFQQLGKMVPGFAAAGLKNFNNEDLVECLQAGKELNKECVLKDFQYEVFEMEGKNYPEEIQNEFRTTFGFTKSNQGKMQKQTQEKQIYVWKDCLRSFDISTGISPDEQIGVILGLISAVSPSERETLSKKFVNAQVQKKFQAIEKEVNASQGLLQLCQASEYIRFVDMNILYAKMCVVISNTFVILKQILDQIRMTDKQNINFKNEKEFSFANYFKTEPGYDSCLQLQKLWLQFIQGKQGKFIDSGNYFVEDNNVVNEAGEKIVFNQAVQFVNQILYEDHLSLTNYINKCCEMMQRDYLIKAARESEKIKVEIQNQKQMDPFKYLRDKTNNELFESLNEDEQRKYKSIDFKDYVNVSLIVHQCLKYELLLMEEKYKNVSLLLQSVQFETNGELLSQTYQQMLQSIKQRPDYYIDFSKYSSIYQEQKLQFIDLNEKYSPAEYSIQSLKQINCPIHLLQSQSQYLAYTNATMATLINIQFQEKKISKIQPGEIPVYIDEQLNYFGFDQHLKLVSKIPKIMEALTKEIHSIFISESYPKAFQSVQPRPNGQLCYKSYKTYLSKQKSSIQLSISEVILEDLITYISQYRELSCEAFILSHNIRHLAQFGLLSNQTCITNLVQQSIDKIKNDDDLKHQVEGQTSQYRERLYSSIVGLMCPAGGGISQNEPGILTETLSQVLSIRELLLCADQASRIQLDQLSQKSCFDMWEGVGELPLPLKVIAQLINHLFSVKLFSKELLMQKALNTAAVRLSKYVQGSDLDENVITMFSRLKLTNDIQKPDYRSIIGKQALSSNLPFSCSVDPYSAKYLFNYDSYSQQHLITLLSSQNITEVDQLALTQENLPSFEDILSMSTEQIGPIYSKLVPAYIGIYLRAAQTENAVNKLKTCCLRCSQIGANFAILSQFYQGNLDDSQEISEQTIEIFDQYDMFRLEDKYQSNTDNIQKGSSTMSSLYFWNCEDWLFNIAHQAQIDYQTRIKQFSQKDLNDLVTFCLSQYQTTTIQKQCCEEVKKLSAQTQIKGYMSIIRTYLNEINQDTQPIMLESQPIYRGTQQNKSDSLQFGFFLNEMGHVEHINSIPHPVLVQLKQYSQQQLDMILMLLMCFESIFRYSALKANLLGQGQYESGVKLQQLLDFVFEIQKVKISETDGELVFPGLVYMESSDVAFVKKQVATTKDMNDQVNILETTKVKLIIQKGLQLRDSLELLTAAALVQSANQSERKGLFQQNIYFMEKLRQYAQKTKMRIKDFDQSIQVDYFQTLLNETELRLVKQNLQTAPLTMKPQMDLQGEFVSELWPLHVTNLMIEKKMEKKDEDKSAYTSFAQQFETPLNTYAVPFISYDPQFPVSYQDIIMSIQRAKIGVDHRKQLIRPFFKQVSHTSSESACFSANGRIHVSQFPLYEEEMEFARVGMNADGSEGVYSQFGISQEFYELDQQQKFYTTMSSSLTQLELDSIYINSTVRQTRQTKELQNQWSFIKYQIILSQKQIEQDRLETLFMALSGADREQMCSLSTMFTEPEKFMKKGFEQRIEEMVPPENGTAKAQQDFQRSIIEKKGLQKKMLSQNIFLMLDEQPLDGLLTANAIQSLKESTHFLKFWFSNTMGNNYKIFVLQYLHKQLKIRTQTVTDKLKFDLKLPSISQSSMTELNESFINFMQSLKHGNYISDMLSPYCKKNPSLNPFVTNIQQALQPQILQVLCGILGLVDFTARRATESFANNQKLQQMKQMMKILQGENNSEYANNVMDIMSVIQKAYLNYSVMKTFTKTKFDMNNMFDKYSKVIYGAKKTSSKILTYGELSLQMAPMGIHVDDLIILMNRIYTNLQDNLLQYKVYNNQQSNKFQQFFAITKQNLNMQDNMLQPKIKQTTKEIDTRSLAVMLNPEALKSIQQIDSMQQDVYNLGYQLIVQENQERDAIHDVYHEKFANLLEQILQAKEQQKAIITRKFRITRKAVAEVKNDTSDLYRKLTDLSEYCKLPYETKPDELEARFKNMIEQTGTDQPFVPDRQQIVEQYQENLKLARDQQYQIRQQAILQKQYTNYLIQTKKILLEAVSQKISGSLTSQSREIWEHLGEAFVIDREMEQQMSQLTQLIAQKTSSVQLMKQKLESSGRHARANIKSTPSQKRIQTGKSASKVIKQSLYTQTAMKMLPVLTNVAVTKALKICNEGETLVVLYKQKLEELTKVNLENQQLETLIAAQQNQFKQEQNALKTQMMKEKDILDRTENRKGEMQKQFVDLHKQLELQEQMSKQKAQLVLESKITQLSTEKENVTGELKNVEKKIKILMEQNKKLFDAVGNKMEEVVQQFEATEKYGIGAKANRAKSGKRM
ncbi:Conserved_hypothetical protein [Hexamita inflata]|uniref:Uncharacterized protein n=1 Tax=Hexamita inflata TaxID=28002 RepID=A0AA86UZ61_9EUKA|nr:Conserved hypothetical protein [Hexamita inflata]